MQKTRHQYRKRSPAERGTQANLPLKIEPLMGIIPVAHLEKSLHHHARHIFQRRCPDTAGEENQNQIVPHRSGYQKHHDRPGAVQRQKRPADKPPVHKFSLTDGNVCGFKAPAEEAVKEEKKPAKKSTKKAAKTEEKVEEVKAEVVEETKSEEIPAETEKDAE